jgi:hypothetical protein
MSKYQELFGKLLPQWQISAACSTSTCVAVLDFGPLVLVRDSKNGADPDQPLIEIEKDDWGSLMMAVAECRGLVEVDSPIRARDVEIQRVDGRVVVFQTKASGVVLRFSSEEWEAFASGVALGEFLFEEVGVV